MGHRYLIKKTLDGEIISKKPLRSAFEWQPWEPGIMDTVVFEYSNAEREALCNAFRGAVVPDGFIDELELTCEGALAPQPSYSNRTNRLTKMHAAVAEFEGTLRQLREFAYEHLNIEGRQNEIAATVSQIMPHLIRLEGLLASTKHFKRFSGGRRHNPRALELARGVKRAFEIFQIPLSADRSGIFFEVMGISLEAIQPHCDGESLPSCDPSRLIKKVMDETY